MLNGCCDNAARLAYWGGKPSVPTLIISLILYTGLTGQVHAAFDFPCPQHCALSFFAIGAIGAAVMLFLGIGARVVLGSNIWVLRGLVLLSSTWLAIALGSMLIGNPVVWNPWEIFKSISPGIILILLVYTLVIIFPKQLWYLAPTLPFFVLWIGWELILPTLFTLNWIDKIVLSDAPYLFTYTALIILGYVACGKPGR